MTATTRDSSRLKLFRLACSRCVAQSGNDFGLWGDNNLKDSSFDAYVCSEENAVRQSLDVYLANSNRSCRSYSE